MKTKGDISNPSSSNSIQAGEADLIQDNDDNATSTQLLCPFSLKPLPLSTQPLNIAVIFSRIILSSSRLPTNDGGDDDNSAFGCGHKCTLLPLVDYLHNDAITTAAAPSSSSGSIGHNNNIIKSLNKACPVCGKSDIAMVYDLIAAKMLLSINTPPNVSSVITDMMDQCDVICFKYGRLVYCLSVLRKAEGAAVSSSLWGGTSASSGTVQERIGHVLGMDASKGLKILHKGKVLYPDPDSSPQDISSHLLDISKTDLEKQKKKPSLVVMGTRIGHGMEVHGNGGGMFGPGGYFSLFYWAFSFVFRSVRGFLTGIYLFVRSILYLPDADERRNE